MLRCGSCARALLLATGLTAAAIEGLAAGQHAPDRDLYGVVGRNAREFPGSCLWSDGGRYLFSRLYGKVVVIYFFNVKRGGMALIENEARAAAAKYAGRPVLFLAVADEGRLADAQKAAQALGFPVLADPFDDVVPSWGAVFSGWGLGRQTYGRQAVTRVVGPDGVIAATDATDAEIDKALGSAEWKYADRVIPPSIRPAVQLLEFGQVERAIPLLARAKESKGAGSEEAADLLARFEEDAIAELRKAGTLLAADLPADAYFAYKAVARAYPGLDQAKEAERLARTLESRREVQTEIAAMRAYEQLETLTYSGKQDLQKTIVPALEQLMAKWPGTRAAAKAKDLLRYISSQRGKI